ncbi:MAG: type II toxin-antitoxin system PemK/MazF family toxin [Planctomycetia bacterium]|nr:type II toxin-antitoxin system PemK/MazF family toxin [Planctomycetia bacterium]
MIVERGQVINARFPHASGTRGKKRPVVVIQADIYNQRLRHVVVAQITTNLDDKEDPACFLIEASTPEGQAAGFARDSLFSGYLISLMREDRLQDVIGKLTDEAMRKADGCLKVALGLG